MDHGWLGLTDNGFTPAKFAVDSTNAGRAFALPGVLSVESDNSLKVEEAIGITSDITVSQEMGKAGEGFVYYDAVGQRAYEILAQNWVDVSEAVCFSYETFRTGRHFVVIAKALLNSGMEGRIIYESGKWVGTDDIRKEWLP